ncbi:MAG: hypothetical protein QXO96_08110, partial [Sulfolobales archaeon]
MGIIRDALLGFLSRLATTPFSLLFAFLIAASLSHQSIEAFGEWQTYYVIFSSFLTIPADTLSIISVRYTAEGKPMGGVIILQLLFATISTILALFLGMNTVIPMIISYYILRTVLAITQGTKPLLVNLSNIMFQIGRLVSAVILLYIYNLSILAPSLAYSIGYILQILFVLKNIKGNLKIDFKIAIKTLKNSIVIIFERLQYIIEGTIVLFLLFIGGFYLVAFYEAAIVVSSVATLSGAANVGVIKSAITNKDNRFYDLIKLIIGIIGIVTLGVITGATFLIHLIREVYSIITPAVYLLTISTSFRVFYATLYNYLIAIDEKLSIEKSDPFKSVTGRILRKNMFFSATATLTTMIIILTFKLQNNILYTIIVASVPLLITSFFMIISVYSALRDKY